MHWKVVSGFILGDSFGVGQNEHVYFGIRKKTNEFWNLQTERSGSIIYRLGYVRESHRPLSSGVLICSTGFILTTFDYTCSYTLVNQQSI